MSNISILTPSYNYGRFLGDAIRSVQMQTGGHLLEHLVQDAGSTDETATLLGSAPVSVHWRIESDAGQSDALNRCLARAHGDIVGWLNADEFYLRDAFTEVARTFAEDPRLDVVFGDTVFVGERGERRRLVARPGYLAHVLRNRGCYISTCSLFIRREALAGFQFDTQLRTVMDWDLLLWLQARGARFAYLRRPLAAFRLHSAQVTAAPIPRMSPEHMNVRNRYAVADFPRLRIALGDATYALAKLANGAKAREVLYRHRTLDDPQLWIANAEAP